MRRRVPKITTDRARALRREATPAEKALWRLLSTHRPRFTTQLSVHPYVIDLACRQAKLAIELDGSQHAEQVGYDEQRTAYLERQGWRVIRFWNSDVLTNPEGAAEFIIAQMTERLGGIVPEARSPRPVRRRRG